MSHTPGPWKFQQDGNEPYWSVDMPFTDGSGRYGAYNAMVYTTEEDARLVAAAPELLAALKDLLDQMHCIGLPEWHGADGLCFDRANAAVASAEGRGE